MPYDNYLVNNPDEIAISISQSAKIEQNDILEILPDIPIISIEVLKPDVNDLKSKIQATRLLEKFKEVVDNFRNCKVIHLFSAVPVPVAFMIGQSISETMHPKIQLYQFTQSLSPRNAKAIIIND